MAYAAAVAKAYGLRAHIVTTAAPDTDLSPLEGHAVHRIQTNDTLTFEHTYTWWGNHRKLRVTARPNVTLTLQHVPPRWRRARRILLAPLLPQDLDVPSFVAFRGRPRDQRVSLLAQGLQRTLAGDDGRVVPLARPHDDLWAALTPQTTVFLSDVEVEPWPPGTQEAMAHLCAHVVVTQGEKGAYVRQGNTTAHIPAQKVQAVDTNGAGDVFSTVFTLEEMKGYAATAGETAAHLASLAVQRPQACKPACAALGLREALTERAHGGKGDL